MSTTKAGGMKAKATNLLLHGVRPKLKGDNKYFRLCIRRVFPYVKGGENEKSN